VCRPTGICVVIVLIVGGGPCGLARIAIGTCASLATVGSSWSRAAPRLWTTVEQGLLLPPRLPRAARLIERIGLLT